MKNGIPNYQIFYIASLTFFMIFIGHVLWAGFVTGSSVSGRQLVDL